MYKGFSGKLFKPAAPEYKTSTISQIPTTELSSCMFMGVAFLLLLAGSDTGLIQEDGKWYRPGPRVTARLDVCNESNAVPCSKC